MGLKRISQRKKFDVVCLHMPLTSNKSDFILACKSFENKSKNTHVICCRIQTINNEALNLKIIN